MKIGIISGSPRNGSETGRVCRHIGSRLETAQKNVEYQFFDLSKIHLPLWDMA